MEEKKIGERKQEWVLTPIDPIKVAKDTAKEWESLLKETKIRFETAKGILELLLKEEKGALSQIYRILLQIYEFILNISSNALIVLRHTINIAEDLRRENDTLKGIITNMLGLHPNASLKEIEEKSRLIGESVDYMLQYLKEQKVIQDRIKKLDEKDKGKG